MKPLQCGYEGRRQDAQMHWSSCRRHGRIRRTKWCRYDRQRRGNDHYQLRWQPHNIVLLASGRGVCVEKLFLEESYSRTSEDLPLANSPPNIKCRSWSREALANWRFPPRGILGDREVHSSPKQRRREKTKSSGCFRFLFDCEVKHHHVSSIVKSP